MRCNGYSWEEIDRHTDLVIRVHGFTSVHVEAVSPWTYTVGAYESWDQPELLVVDVDPVIQKALIAAVAEDYADFGEIQESTLELLDIELLPVDGSHFARGLVGAWEERYCLSAVTGDFVQIVPGQSWCCDDCTERVRRLDEPPALPA
jgi:hypothetical protein